MALILQPNQVCPFTKTCPYKNSANDYCHGALSTRVLQFVCDFADENGLKIKENMFRSKLDVTGKMEILHD